MRLHESADGTHTRCLAKKRVGQGVTGCPIGASGHVDGRAGLAASGGGLESRREKGKQIIMVISGLRADGTYTVTSPMGFVRTCNADGTVITLRAQQKAQAKAKKEAANKTN